MTYTVTVTGTDISFPCEPDESVLDAAERSGYAIPYSCRKGVCSSCEGALDAGRLDVRGWGMSQGPQSGVLFCQARPSTDTSITPKRITKQDTVIRKTLTAKVHRITRPAPDVTVVQLRLPTGVRAKFAAGQYLKVFLDDGDSRSYSMANPPHENDGVQLHIRRVQGGRFSDEMLGGLERGTRLRIELPYGEFSLNPDSDRPVIFVASGTGFAPVKSIIEDHLKRGGERSVHLYWGARGQGDIYLPELPAKWASDPGRVSFTPVLSHPAEDWTGRTGLVHRAVLEDYANLSDHEVYACGSPAMTSAAREDFVHEAGLAPDNFYCDAFVPSGEPVVTA
ncbi:MULTISPECIES: 2Fe-2S iron-sulfur cluster-binding protein [unclassified Rhodococcus (in: high G+C Gram-positive bacteria)]|uniref:2Fe-2S iron-sulfur cluster-binding protein n=1 Tax=unclassified Rhodococcus (in: high G+C Gram-positive bacteria) TaxID=192944 RepID=UPI0000233531|nr:2Fe-2S iron-sulfur cluster-binding protein [Rhodococcus sp. DK17]AAR90190.1 putative flavodoxin oxidoreductase [Rhodococcus sp. DK17]